MLEDEIFDDEIHETDEGAFILTEDADKTILEWARFNMQLLEMQGLDEVEDESGDLSEFMKWFLMALILDEHSKLRGWNIDG